MNIFISWSGELSHAIALAFSRWLPQVINAVKPWLSSQDIEKGTRWFSEIGTSLAQTEFGILCLTASNLNAPWILFEAGALSKSLDQSRVSPLLIDIANADLRGPLAQFNTTSLSKIDVQKLVGTINARLPHDSKRSEKELHEAFEVWWPRLEKEVHEAQQTSGRGEAGKSPVQRRKTEEILDEILELSRTTAQRVLQLRPLEESGARPATRTVGGFANELKLPVPMLIEQLRLAGVQKDSQFDLLSEEDKGKLLHALRSAHSEPSIKRKIVLQAKHRRDDKDR